MNEAFGPIPITEKTKQTKKTPSQTQGKVFKKNDQKLFRLYIVRNP
jgi:hypothetical protein